MCMAGDVLFGRRAGEREGERLAQGEGREMGAREGGRDRSMIKEAKPSTLPAQQHKQTRHSRYYCLVYGNGGSLVGCYPVATSFRACMDAVRGT